MQKAVDRVFEMQDSSRRLRCLGPVARRPVADGLRHRLPDARQGAGLRGQPAGLQPGARPAAELHRLRRGLREGRRGPRLRALRARPQRPRADRRAALLRRHASRPLLDAARQGPARCRAGDDGRQDARRDGVRLRARQPQRAGRRRTSTAIAPTTAPTCATAPPSSPSPRRRASTNVEAPKLVNVIAKAYARPHLHLDAGAGVDAAGRQRAGRAGQATLKLIVNGAPVVGRAAPRRCRRRTC